MPANNPRPARSPGRERGASQPPALARQNSVPAVAGDEWLPEAAVKPLQYGPIKVKMAVHFQCARAKLTPWTGKLC